MFKRAIIALFAITVFMSVTALAAPKVGCKKFNFIGTFLAPSESDVFGDGHIHKFAFQLTFSSDGTVNQYWTGLPDYIINAGTGSPQIGSWTCRDDGKLVMVWLQASYIPITVDQDPVNLTSQDVTLLSHSRTTYLFTVDSDNTITRLQSRTRRYTPTQDPTDAAGGTLLAAPDPQTVATYTRLTASDADLLAP
jgi:hypothetical protein